eukprot:gene10925-3630_t
MDFCFPIDNRTILSYLALLLNNKIFPKSYNTDVEVIVTGSNPRNCQLSYVKGYCVDKNHGDDIADRFSTILAYFSQEEYQLWNINIQNSVKLNLKVEEFNSEDKKHQSEYIKASNELLSCLKKFDGKDNGSVFLKLIH